MNPQLDKLIAAVPSRSQIVRIVVSAGNAQVLSNRMIKLVKAAYKAGAMAAIEATKVYEIPRGHTIPVADYAVGYDSARSKQQALSDQFLQSITDTQ